MLTGTNNLQNNQVHESLTFPSGNDPQQGQWKEKMKK